MSAFLEKLFVALGKMPSTNTRIAVTLVCVFMTAVRVIAGGDVALEWLGFLLAMAGVDAMQFAAKRVTHKGDTSTVGKESV